MYKLYKKWFFIKIHHIEYEKLHDVIPMYIQNDKFIDVWVYHWWNIYFSFINNFISISIYYHLPKFLETFDIAMSHSARKTSAGKGQLSTLPLVNLSHLLIIMLFSRLWVFLLPLPSTGAALSHASRNTSVRSGKWGENTVHVGWQYQQSGYQQHLFSMPITGLTATYV